MNKNIEKIERDIENYKKMSSEEKKQRFEDLKQELKETQENKLSFKRFKQHLINYINMSIDCNEPIDYKMFNYELMYKLYCNLYEYKKVFKGVI